MCSAAYWLASQCGTVTCTHSANVGSIGVILSWIDCSEAMAKEGYKLVCYQGGRLKSAGIDGREMTAEEDAMFKGRVSKLYDEFREVVTAARPQITDESMQGQAFFGSEAIAAGLVDYVAADLDEVIEALEDDEDGDEE